MTKVYIVTAGEYDDYCIMAVFSSFELADEFVDKMKKSEYDPVWIEEYELDKKD